jgi:hypothetical protein
MALFAITRLPQYSAKRRKNITARERLQGYLQPRQNIDRWANNAWAQERTPAPKR